MENSLTMRTKVAGADALSLHQASDLQITNPKKKPENCQGLEHMENINSLSIITGAILK